MESLGLLATFVFNKARPAHSPATERPARSEQRRHAPVTMPVQAPQWTEFLLCPICTQTFEENVRKPISLGCGHTVCKMCLNKLHRKACPFDQTAISTDIELLPVNTALLQLVCPQVRRSRVPKGFCSRNFPAFIVLESVNVGKLTELKY